MTNLGGGQQGPPQAPGTSGGYGAVTGMIVGAVLQSIGAFYSVKSAQYQAKSKALSLEFEQSMSYINARNAERAAQHSLLSGQYEAGKVGLQYGQVKEATLTRQAARGIQGGVGSAGEIAASIDFAKESDQLAITRNSVMAANAHRTQRVNIMSHGRLAGVSAQNLRSQAGAMMPWVSSLTTLMGGSGQVARSWYEVGRST